MNVLKLIAWFNWVFQACTRFHHGHCLGFQSSNFRALHIWNNWTLRPLPLKSAPSTEWNWTIAPNFFSTLSYSLFSVDIALGGFKTPAISFSLQVHWGRRLAWHGVSGWFESSALFFYFITLRPILFYIICFLFHEQSAQLAHLAKHFIGKYWGLGLNPRPPSHYFYYFA